MICEADGREALSFGMRCITIRLAKRWNKSWGSVFDDHYHAVRLGSLGQVRNALVYVLQNARRHGVVVRSWVDPFSTAPAFESWREVRPVREEGRYPRARHRRWALREGWLRARGGMLSIHERAKAERVG